MSKKKTHEEFVEEVKGLVGDVYEFLTSYDGNKKYIKIQHRECQYEWEIKPNVLLTGIKNGNIVCPNCSNQVKLTTESFKERVKELVGNEYDVLGECVDNSTKVKMRHNVCGNVYNVKPNGFQQGRRCPECSIKSRADKRRKTQEQFEKEVYVLVGSEYAVKSKYINNGTKIQIYHNTCNRINEVTPDQFLRGHRCPYCAHNREITTEMFKEAVWNLVGNEYKILGEYRNSDTKVKILHVKCNHTYEVLAYSFVKQGHRCPECTRNVSKGEIAVAKWLDESNISYEPQYKFEDCRNVNCLPFDFAIFKENKLTSLVEYDGKQHFEPVDYFGGEEEFKNVQIRDQIKNQYCESNNIYLLRIPYWEYDNIDIILSDYIN